MISVITCTIRDQCLENVFSNFLSQTFSEKELIIVLNDESMNLTSWTDKASQYSNVKVYMLSKKYTLGECLNFAGEKANYEFIANFEDDDYYSPDYIKESYSKLTKLKLDVLGKTTVYIYFKSRQTLSLFNPGNENQYIKHNTSFGKQYLQGSTLFFKKTVLNEVKFPTQIREVDRIFTVNCIKKNLNVYSGSRDHFVYVRESDHNKHTWRIPEELLLKVSKFIAQTTDYTKHI
jgi:cellulose synthase/poly-beta-1,6-N-acetylglucosamine synthase-like glycosyltransferase